MRDADEPNVDLLRKKAAVLESENVRLSSRLAEVLRENLKLKGMTPEAIELNLPGLLKQAAGNASSAGVTQPGSERRARDKNGDESGKPQKGHGPTPQRGLETIQEAESR